MWCSKNCLCILPGTFFLICISKTTLKAEFPKSEVHLQYLVGTNVGEGLNETIFCLKD